MREIWSCERAVSSRIRIFPPKDNGTNRIVAKKLNDEGKSAMRVKSKSAMEKKANLLILQALAISSAVCLWWWDLLLSQDCDASDSKPDYHRRRPLLSWPSLLRPILEHTMVRKESGRNGSKNRRTGRLRRTSHKKTKNSRVRNRKSVRQTSLCSCTWFEKYMDKQLVEQTMADGRYTHDVVLSVVIDRCFLSYKLRFGWISKQPTNNKIKWTSAEYLNTYICVCMYVDCIYM